MEMDNKKSNVYSTGEGDPSTGVGSGSKVSHITSSYDDGCSEMNHQILGRVSASRKEVQKETSRRNSDISGHSRGSDPAFF